MSVSMTPGFSGTAAMPLGSSCAIASVKPSIAYLEAQYGATSGDVARPQPLDRLTITPDFRATMAGTNARMQFATPLILMSISRSKSAAPIVQSGPSGFMIAALLMSRSGGPTLASTSFAQFVTAFASVTSTAAKMFGEPNCFSSSATCVADRPHPATVSSACTNRGTSALPSPRVAPVKTMIFPIGYLLDPNLQLDTSPARPCFQSPGRAYWHPRHRSANP